jgi:hypothetical protein
MRTFASLLLVFVMGAVTMAALPRPRFERVMFERMPMDSSNIELYFTVIHDRESGQEVVCVNVAEYGGNNRPVSCYPTGRSWGAGK